MNLPKLGCPFLGRNFPSCSNVTLAQVAQYQKSEWNRAVSDAEKIVGYPTTWWILNEEIANLTLQLKKLVGSNHSLLKTVKGFVFNSKSDMQAWGLIVLLISKAAGQIAVVTDMEQDKAAGVLHSQRALAEVTEMIRTSHLVHKGLVNLQDFTEDSSDVMFGNKIALLSGDYLLGNSSAELADLRNQELVLLMSSAVRDLAEAEFVGPRDRQNNPLPARPLAKLEFIPTDENGLDYLIVSEALGNAKAEWTLRHVLSGGSLLGKSCQGTLKLAGHSVELQKQGYVFGKHLALACQACLDREPFMHGSTGMFGLVSAPVMFHLQHDPSLYDEIEKGQNDVQDVDYEEIRKAVLGGPGLDLTQKLQREHSQAALEVLNQLPLTDARTALENIIVAIQDM